VDWIQVTTVQWAFVNTVMKFWGSWKMEISWAAE
jgi:hypothetical protein